MAGQKRTRSGAVKSTDATQPPPANTPVAESTPPCAQPPLPSSKTSKSRTTTQTADPVANTTKPPHNPLTKPNPEKTTRPKREKLPPNTTISKRPLIHPAHPTPFSSSTLPKVVYIKPSTPFLPALKRIRSLLSEIARRDTQSRGGGSKHKRPVANGRLRNGDVEKGIADEMSKKEGKREGEKVYLKATGRAIPRALELGVQFQGEGGEYVVKVEMGSVRAVDDVEVVGHVEEDVPETRMRTVSSVTVSIGMK